MKSIMEQASSIAKAVEKAWNRAGNPEEFSIKVFQTEERNFFGMTTKPAKIGIFFTEKPAAPAIHKDKAAPREPQQEKQKPRQPQAAKPPAEAKAKPQPAVKAQPAKQPAQQPPISKEKPEASQETKPQRPTKQRAAWKDEMVTAAQSWVKTTLSLMELPNIEFTTQVKGKHLTLMFANPVLSDNAAEAQLFRCFAHLIISTLQNKFKQELRDLKVIVARSQNSTGPA